MPAPPIVEAFRATQTTAARREALAALVNELSPHEWRQVQLLLNARSFQFDIIGTLPPELVFHIFSYLDTSTPFRLQRVSRRWRYLLRNTDVLKRPLKAWYDGTVSFQDASYDDYLLEAQKIQRFRTGKYLDVVATPPRREGHLSSDRIILLEHVIVTLDPPRREIQVHNLHAGGSWKARADARESIAVITASDRLVVFSTSRGICYVFDLFGLQKAKFRLPQRMLANLTCRESTVISGGYSVTPPARIELYIWDLESQHGRTLVLNQPPFIYNMSTIDCIQFHIIPNPHSKTFTLFTVQECQALHCGHDTVDGSIHYARFTFDGHLLEHNRFEIPSPLNGTHTGTWTVITSIRPVDRCSGFSVEVRTGDFLYKNINSFYFNEDLQIFREPAWPNPNSTPPWPGDVKTAWWKDSFYQLRTIDDPLSNRRQLSFAHVGTSGNPNLEVQPSIDEADVESLWHPPKLDLVVNDNYAVALGIDRTYVFSFGARLDIAGMHKITVPGQEVPDGVLAQDIIHRQTIQN